MTDTASQRRRRRRTDPEDSPDAVATAELEDQPPDEDEEQGPVPMKVPTRHDALGRVVETVEVVDSVAAEHWDERRWHR